MIPAPSELLGLPPAPTGHGLDVAVMRYLALALAGAWCWALARGRRALALGLGVLSVTVATGFWVLALGRPWGVLLDPGATRLAAEVSVASQAPGAGSFVAGEPPGAALLRGLLALGVPAPVVQALPSLLPVIVLPGLALAVGLLWRDRDRAVLGASLVLVASTGELGSVAGWGLLPGVWPHPLGALALLATVAAVLALGRLPGRAAAPSSLAALAVWAAVPAGRPLPLPDALLALSVEQGIWLPLALIGLRAGWDAATRTLVAGGAAMVLLAGLGAPLDAWGAMGLYRVGLILGGTTALWHAAPALGAAARRAAPRVAGGLEARWLAAGLALALAAPGSAVLWWDPLSTDPASAASAEPPSPALEPGFRWIRENTPRDAVFLASPAYASSLSVGTGRRVLRAPIQPTVDEAERVRAERPLLARRPLPARVRHYGVGWVFAAPGDFEARGVPAPEALVGRPGLRLRYRDDARFFVFEVVPDPE